ncbi:MAG: GTP 3',8-cyclase MoaA [Planctomycetota bacterium]|jgi:cyclic pyranopterin phosphate synthase
MNDLALRLSVTDRCNLRCLYCEPEAVRRRSMPREFLSFGEIDRAVRLLARCGVGKVRLTGGEPLVRSGVGDLLTRLGRNRAVTWTLTTNGQRLEKLVPTLKRAGFERVNISLDSLDPGKFRQITQGGELDRTWDGMEAAIAAGLTPVKWNVVVMRDLNLMEAATFAEATVLRPVHVRFIEYMPTESEEDTWRRRFVPSAEVIERIRARHRLEPCVSEPHSPARLFRIPGAQGRIGFISPMSAPFCVDCNRLRLSARGFLYLCLSREQGLDVKAILRGGATDEEVEAALRSVIDGKRRLLHPPDAGIRLAQGMAAVGG